MIALILWIVLKNKLALIIKQNAVSILISSFRSLKHVIADWNETAADLTWCKETQAYLPELTSLGDEAVYPTLSEAQQRCLELSSLDCGGVTYYDDTVTAHSGWQLRKATQTKVSKTCEISFIRPTMMTTTSTEMTTTANASNDDEN